MWALSLMYVMSTLPLRNNLNALIDGRYPTQEDDKPFEVPIPDDSFETYNLDPPPYTLETTKQELRQLYKDMMTIR
jgi:pyruvate dehydrogenase E1 component alpha subunit